MSILRDTMGQHDGVLTRLVALEASAGTGRTSMEFEFDPAKNEVNRVKHGVSLAAADLDFSSALSSRIVGWMRRPVARHRTTEGQSAEKGTS